MKHGIQKYMTHFRKAIRWVTFCGAMLEAEYNEPGAISLCKFESIAVLIATWICKFALS
jgi:hypothetical protein